MVRIKPPSPQKIWRFSSAHFSGKQFPKQTICGTIFANTMSQATAQQAFGECARAMMQRSVIMVVIQAGDYRRERVEYKSHISQSGLYLKNKSYLFLWHAGR